MMCKRTLAGLGAFLLLATMELTTTTAVQAQTSTTAPTTTTTTAPDAPQRKGQKQARKFAAKQRGRQARQAGASGHKLALVRIPVSLMDTLVTLTPDQKTRIGAIQAQYKADLKAQRKAGALATTPTTPAAPNTPTTPAAPNTPAANPMRAEAAKASADILSTLR